MAAVAFASRPLLVVRIGPSARYHLGAVSRSYPILVLVDDFIDCGGIDQPFFDEQ